MYFKPPHIIAKLRPKMIFHFRPATQTSAHVSASCRALSTCDRFGAVVTLVEFVATLEPSVSLPRGVPRLPRPSSPNRGALLCRGIPLLAMRRASARGPRTGPSALLSSTLGLSACSSPAFYIIENTPVINQRSSGEAGSRRFATDGAVTKTREKPMFRTLR